MFGGIGAHPLVILVLQVVLVATAAVLIDELLRKLGVDDRLSWATAALWVVIPNHTSLLLWPTAVAITVSLVLLLLGGVALAAERDAPAACILAAAVLTYEATGPAALALVVAIPLLQRRADWRRPVVMGLAALVPAGLWVALHVPSVKEAGLSRWADLRLVAPAHLGWGVLPEGRVATVVGLAALLLAALAVRRRDPLVIAGLLVIVVGTLPFVRYFYEPLGAGDRVNVVAGVGTAMVWAGLLARSPRHVGVIAPMLLAAAMGVASWQRSMAWADAADDADRILASLPPPHFEETITIDRPPVRHNVTAFASRSNVESAVQLERDRRDGVTVRLRPGR